MFQIGQRVIHSQYGEGIVISIPEQGFVKIFFLSGEKQVPLSMISPLISREEQIVDNVDSNTIRNKEAWLTYKAYYLPLMDSAASLTAAQIDLLPHQVVLTHRVATSYPRRYLIADEVGLGKTIETALILRELISRGELKRALMVVPAGLVNNWYRELNETFNLGFEVFGSEGDVTDRRSNAFSKHDKLIVSIDTLKIKSRMNRLKEAPKWDLTVIDEAHHMSAYKSGGKIKKTQNYKLGELLREHSRDLILLSATPHQGDNFRFKMLINLLNPTLFNDVDDMIENRHRLNSVMFRRTKADACRADGSTLFTRRFVNTESFIMSDEERIFYTKLVEYLTQGFDLSKRLGGQGRALGFVMSIFQKIAASSFAAVKRTLIRRLLALTTQEGILHDEQLDIDKREEAFREAKQIIRVEFNLGNNRISDIEVDSILNEYKRKILKKLNENELECLSDESSTERVAIDAEDSIVALTAYQLPGERFIIKKLLSFFPKFKETKVQKLLIALGYLWRTNKDEKIVIFATYLRTVEMLEKEINESYPGQGVVVLKGGDHGSKTAAEKRFRKSNGPRVMICTAAGREGINLQFSRILFNFDLPWNPMDIEQRIGRIHRYGQKNTAQVYNLVLSDTIEGKIYLILEEKLNEIAKTLGKVDKYGQIAEDLKPQILGQLSERLNYEQLYKNALNDPNLRRTKAELEAAMMNATEARKVVNDLFQDLDKFNLDDYKPFLNIDEGMNEIIKFTKVAVNLDNEKFVKTGDNLYEIIGSDNSKILYTCNRDLALKEENISLLGLDDPAILKYIEKYKSTSTGQIGIRVQSDNGETGVLSIWYIEVHEIDKETKNFVLPLGVNVEGKRIIAWEKHVEDVFKFPILETELRVNVKDILKNYIEPMLLREMKFRNLINEFSNYSTKLISWIEIGIR